MGVELDNGGGDNSGSHSGERYFICKPGHGYSYLPPKVKRLSPLAVAATSSGSSTNSGPTTDSQLTPPSPPPPLIPRLPSTNEDSTPPIPQKLDLEPSSLVQSPSLTRHLLPHSPTLLPPSPPPPSPSPPSPTRHSGDRNECLCDWS
ncbi:hypothetical protein GBAR_LOCUS1914 [Geodia barretti]|uniref:CAP-Gly domain-containing protein n=1 Tax=Geodia barretti TaxID=519541 RepID=A0AA35QYN7_GEOBA|nr:hypothetical protein GBAR_LOCUS1914 [Geodia barretti]